MHQYPTKIFLTLFVLLSVNTYVVAKQDAVKVYDKGQDGGNRIYTIVCPNGKKTTVTQTLNVSSEYTDNNIRTTEVKALDSNVDEGPSLKSTTQNLKKRALRLLGQQNRAEMCLYPVNSKKQCKSYKDVDSAAQAACDLIR
tara:strand:- start:120 stop:542 length:423 start_codon:yes stop_codon:yes gene_type:complete